MMPASEFWVALLLRSTLWLALVLVLARLARRGPLWASLVERAGLVGLALLPLAVFWGPSLAWPILPAPALSQEQPFATNAPLARDAAAKPSRPLDWAPLAPPTATGTSGERVMPSALPVEFDARSTASRPVDARRYLLPLAGGIYVLVMLARVARLAQAWRALPRLAAAGQAIEDPSHTWCAELAREQRLLGISRPVRLILSRQTRVPLTFGAIRPTIVLPAALSDSTSQAERRAILLHELIHIARHDYAWQLAERVVAACYWCHPLMWLLSRSLARTRELACDAACSARLGREDYALTLLELVRRLPPKSPTAIDWAPALALAMVRAPRMAHRLELLASAHCDSRLTLRPAPRVAACLAMLLALVGAGLVQMVSAEPVPPPAQAGAPLIGVGVNSNAGLTGSIALDETKAPSPANSPAKAAEPAPGAAKTFSITRRLVDDADRPIADTELALELTWWVPAPDGELDVESRELTTTTDERGEFRVEFPLLAPAHARYQIDIGGKQAYAPPFAATRAEWEANQEPTVATRLARARGRVLDFNGEPVAEAQVTYYAVDRRGMTQSHAEVKTDAEGRYEFPVLDKLDIGVLVISDRGAVARQVFPAGTAELADLLLKRGTKLTGRVLDRQGAPVANCPVVAVSEDDQRTQAELGFSIDLYRITDAEGRFSFPQLKGRFRVYLSPREFIAGRGDAEFSKLISPPPALPMTLELGEEPRHEMTLNEAPSILVRGQLRTLEGRPIVGHEIRHIVPPDGGSGYLNLGIATTDATGHYELRVPFPLDELRLWVMAYWHDQPAGLDAWAANSAWRATHNQAGHLVIPRPAPDLGEVDWLMVPRGQVPPGEAKREAVPPDQAFDADAGVDPHLLQLEKEIAAANEVYQTASEKAQTQEEREAADRLDPRDLLVDRCLEVEQLHRGTPAAIGALHYLKRAAATTSSGKVVQARRQAIAVLGQHYLRHADLDLLIDEFDAGAIAPEAEPLLRQIADVSPHDYVRATALYELAGLLVDGVRAAKLLGPHAAQMEELLPIQQSEATRAWMREQIAQARAVVDAFGQRDPEQTRGEAVRLLDQVVVHYVGLHAPARQWWGPAFLRLESEDPGTPTLGRRWSIAERADTKRFQITRLQVGQPAPVLEGLGYRQERVRLSDLAGQVVLVTFAMFPVEDRPMYDRCSEVLKEFAGQPVVCLSIVPSDASGGFSVRAIVEQMGITWPIVRDGLGSPLATRWCQDSFPEAYLIDAEGVIRDHFYWGNATSAAPVIAKVRGLLPPGEAAAAAPPP